MAETDTVAEQQAKFAGIILPTPSRSAHSLSTFATETHFDRPGITFVSIRPDRGAPDL